MKLKVLLFFLAIIVALTTFTLVFADDGFQVLKSMSQQRKPTVRGYVDEAEHAFIQMMKFYVPAQAASGESVTIEYETEDGAIEESRTSAKPLIGAFIFGPSEGVEGVGFVGHGKRDAYGAVSLDDGMTWKKTNLSESSDLTSCDGNSEGGCSVERRDIKLFKDTKYAYPGDVVNIFHAVAGNNVLVAWPSRYCQSGQPNYSLDTDTNIDRREAIATYLGLILTDETYSAAELYLVDMYGVGGQQGSVDYAEDKFEQNQVVGEVPYSCLWTARGVLVQGDDPRTGAVEASYMRWFKAERLTSGRRDVNRIETQCVEGAGCAITWQEDPEGLRGGQGLGPGEGWSGATAHSQTDIWYSYIPWDYFDVVQDPTDDSGETAMDFGDFTEDGYTEKPKPYVPFAMPMRMTDNAKCNVDNPQPYCEGYAILGGEMVLDDYGLRDMCAATIDILTGPNDELKPVCVTEDGLPLVGNTASTRPRLGLFGYDSTGDGATDSAFVVVEAEEDKGLGAFGFTDDYDPNATGCNPETDDSCDAFDEGKNLWYYSFSMSLTDGVGDWTQDSLPANLASHGNILNQPEISWVVDEGDFYPVRNTELMWDFGDYNYDIYNTEIARRGSLLAQGIDKAQNSTNRLIALPAWKQGIMNQGGPADVMMRRIVIPDNWTLTDTEIGGNPYAFRNMDCDTWDYDDGLNPMYPEGICLDPAINLSATIPDTCINSATGAVVTCPVVDEDGTTETNPVLQGKEVEPNTTKVLTWHQCPAEFTRVSATAGIAAITCDDDAREGASPLGDSTLADQSWYNPLDVAKGHRGFLDGDFVMVLYAWSPNWRLNVKGSDRYDLYVRRSFDGAETWQTTPSSFTASDGETYDEIGDGTVTCETYRRVTTQNPDEDEPRVCNEYAAGANEQARNVTQLKSMRFTTLDPRYAPTAGTIDDDDFPFEQTFEPDYEYTDEDMRDPSRYFIVYETGDNTTTAEGEPEPLDLFYSRAINFGDDYVVWAAEEDGTMDQCYPSDTHDQVVPEELEGSGFCNEFDQMEQGKPGLEASEASLAANPGGEFLYGAWSQALIVEQNKNKTVIEESDAMARRVWWLDDYIPTWDFGQGTGDGVPAN